MNTEKLYRTAEVSALTGLSLRQLQWADEHGTLKARRRGSKGRQNRARYYTATQLETARKLAQIGQAAERSRQIVPAKHLRRFIDQQFTKVYVLREPTIIDGVLFIPRQKP